MRHWFLFVLAVPSYRPSSSSRSVNLPIDDLDVTIADLSEGDMESKRVAALAAPFGGATRLGLMLSRPLRDRALHTSHAMMSTTLSYFFVLLSFLCFAIRVCFSAVLRLST